MKNRQEKSRKKQKKKGERGQQKEERGIIQRYFLIINKENENNIILLLVKDDIIYNEDLVIRNCYTGNRIEDFFTPIMANTPDNNIGFVINDKTEAIYVPTGYDVQCRFKEKKFLYITIERLTRLGGGV